MLLKEKGVLIIQKSGIVSAVAVIVAGFIGVGEARDFTEYVILAGFGLLAYVPFAILAHIAKKNMMHVVFFAVFGLVMLALNMYANYDAYTSDSSTAGLVYIVMPVYLTGATLVMWGAYAIFKKIRSKKEVTETGE